MSLNTAHANNGIVIDMGEYILLHSKSVTMEFSGQDLQTFKGSKRGSIYLTSHRMVFINKDHDDLLQSFSAPLIVLADVELEQPIFGANYIKGKVRAQPNGNFVGEVKFKLLFKAGGAIEYGQALLRAASLAQRNFHHGGPSDPPPPYIPPGSVHDGPPQAYEPPPGYYGWLPQHDSFSPPQQNSVFISDNPPAYPGIGGPPAYNPNAPATGQYGPPQGQFGFAPPAGQFDAPQGYPGPPQDPYGSPQGQYGPPQGQYGPPQGQYGPPQGQYGPPQGQYGPPQGQHGPPQGQYGPPQGQYAPSPAYPGPPQFTPATTYAGGAAGQNSTPQNNAAAVWNGFSLPPEKQ